MKPTVKPCSGHIYQDKRMTEHRISTEHRPFYPDEQQPAKRLMYSAHILSCASCCHQDISIHQTEYPATNHFKKYSNRKRQNSTKWEKNTKTEQNPLTLLAFSTACPIADATLPIVVKEAMTMFLLLSTSRPLRAPNNSPGNRTGRNN